MSKLEIRGDSLYIDGAPFFLVSGDIHYFRIYPGGLKRRLRLMKEFGLTAVQTYVPWSLHEPEEGRFCFDGLCDLKGFLEACREEGLYVLLRPSPYICSELDNGGLPYWLTAKTKAVRCCGETYMQAVGRYMKRVCAEFVPFLSTNGGPVIAVAVENEYGSYGNDRAYLTALRDMLLENGVDVPLYATDGYCGEMFKNGSLDGVWEGVNYRVESKIAIEKLRLFRPGQPALIGEYWSGQAFHWGENGKKRNISDVAEGFREALENGGLLNFYMFAGGTNFGLRSGANFGCSFSAPEGAPSRYIPHITSYDEDALLDETGAPTEKYAACKSVLDAFFGRTSSTAIYRPLPPQSLEPIKLTLCGSLLGSADYSKAVRSALPLTFEQLQLDYGYCLYRTTVTNANNGNFLRIEGLRDRADVYIDGVYSGTYMRDREAEPIRVFCPECKTVTLELLVENMGRINYGEALGEDKGITQGVYLGWTRLSGWECLPLREDDVMNVPASTDAPAGAAVFTGSFTAEAGRDIVLDMRHMCKGFLRVNGFNLGRYWRIGPQYSLYVPGELVKETNTVEVFEQYADKAEPLLSTLPGVLIE